MVKNCIDCGMTYYPEYGESRKHTIRHDEYLFGVSIKPATLKVCVGRSDDIEVYMVTNRSSIAQRKFAERIARRAHRDTEFDSMAFHHQDTSLPSWVFIGVKNSRCISMVIMRKTRFFRRVSWDFCENLREPEPFFEGSPVWKIARIWTLESERRRGYSFSLIKIASKELKVPVAEIGWSVPFSKYGHGLAKAVSPNDVLLTD